MEFNDKWTKEINDTYRQLIREKKSYDEIEKIIGRKIMDHHPNGKFNHDTVLSYGRFMSVINEIKFHPNYIDFGFRTYKSLRFTEGEDIRCFFTVNDVEYILVLEYLIENNEFFKNEIVYNVFFTTKTQYDEFVKTIHILKTEEIERRFYEIQDKVEKETNFHDIIKIFNSLSYILLKMINLLKNNILLIASTNNQKIKFYIKSIEDSFKDSYDLKIGKSQFFDGISYYFKIKK